MTPSTDLMTSVMEVTKEVRNPKVRGMAKSIAIDPALNEGVLAMMERAAEMRSPITALLAGIAAIPSARRMWEDSLDAMWEKNRVSSSLVPEVVIGSGFHAAVYCAVRASMGMEPPIILEAAPRAGGTFARSRSATFYLNSRNRPGSLSIPRNQGALNFLPGAMVQPADLSGEEYQVNSDLAFAIRSVFALTGAKVVPNMRVQSLRQTYTSRSRSYYNPQWYVEINLAGGRRLKAERVVVASGIGEPLSQWGKLDRVLEFGDFLGHLDQPFPLRGMRRVAVIGAGDSGKCAVEALTGQGPGGHMSVASLDYPDQIVWFGQQSYDRDSFESCNRPRYKRIATLLESPSENRNRRIQPRSQRVDYVEPGYDCILVNGEPFDFVVNCTGFRAGETLDRRNLVSDLPQLAGDSARYVPNENRDYAGPRIIYVGPAAQIPRSTSEQIAVPDAPTEDARREALVAAYRYAGRTAMLAKSI